MTPNPRLAGRYAKSILDLSIEKDTLDDVYKDMVLLQTVCRTSRDFVNLLRSPVIPEDKKIKIWDAITTGKISALTTAFFKLLLSKDREANLPEIVTAFIAQYKDHKGIRIVKLTTAAPVGEQVKKAILEKVRGNVTSKEIELDTEVNDALIGGFILEIGDRMIDGSISFELNNIKKQFENNDFIYKIR